MLLTNNSSMITVSHLSKKYGNKLAVSDLNFTVPDGKVTGFLGPNGSGKSTTMRCILGLDTPTSGQVTFEHDDYLGSFSDLKNKSSIAGAILDTSWYHPQRSGRKHLKAIAAGARISNTRIEECLRLVGLSEVANQKVGGYSLGMKQRLGVATALLGDPQHLILDEPVNGLDPEGVNWMRSIIRRLAADGKAVMVSSHLLSEMEQTADRIVVIGKGQMIGEHNLDEFLADGTTVRVQSPDLPRLADCVGSLGFDYRTESTNNTDTTLIVTVPATETERSVRAAIATMACEEGLPIFAMTAVRENLEQRFLTATSAAQEYRTAVPV